MVLGADGVVLFDQAFTSQDDIHDHRRGPWNKLFNQLWTIMSIGPRFLDI